MTNRKITDQMPLRRMLFDTKARLSERVVERERSIELSVDELARLLMMLRDQGRDAEAKRVIDRLRLVNDDAPQLDKAAGEDSR